MRLITCFALGLLITEGSHYSPTSTVDGTSSSWGYKYSLSDSRGFGAKHDDKGFYLFPLDTNNTGFKKQYTEKTEHDHFTSKDGQPTSHTHTVDEYTATSKPTSADDNTTAYPNFTSPKNNGDTASSTVVPSTISPSNGNVDQSAKPLTNKTRSTLGESDTPVGKMPGPSEPGTSPNNVPSPLGEPGTPNNKPVNKEPARPGYPAYGPTSYGLTSTSPHHVTVETLSGTPNVGTFGTSYGYNVPPAYPTYSKFGAPIYNSHYPMYGVPNNQMGYPGPTGPMYGSASSPVFDTLSWPTYGPQNGQMFGSQLGQSFGFVRRPMYGVPQRIYY